MTFPFKEELEDIVEAVQGGRVQQWTVEQVVHEPQSPQRGESGPS